MNHNQKREKKSLDDRLSNSLTKALFQRDNLTAQINICISLNLNLTNIKKTTLLIAHMSRNMTRMDILR
jgi:hypothetical protein